MELFNILKNKKVKMKSRKIDHFLKRKFVGVKELSKE